MRYIGVDVHKDECVAAIVDENGNVVERKRFRNNRKAWLKFIHRHCKGEVKIAMEATTYAMKPYDLLKEKGIDVYLANTYKLKIITQSKKKTDNNDSESLAQLLRTNYLPLAYVPSFDVRQKRAILRFREDIVKNIVAIKNRVHSILSENLIELKGEYSDIFGKKGRKELGSLEDIPFGAKRLRSIVYLTYLNPMKPRKNL